MSDTAPNISYLDQTGLGRVWDKVLSKLSNKADTSALKNYLPLSGGTLTGLLNAPKVETGTGADSYFQSRKFRGEGTALTYYHAIDFGYQNHNQVDFYEYGGVWNFWRNTGADATSANSNMVASLRLGCLYERGNKLEYPGKSGTIALTSDIESASDDLKELIDAKYTKPDDGIPKADLSKEVQEAINTSGDMFVINEDGSVKLNSKYTGLWTEGFLSARSKDDSGSSGGGANLEAVWKSLKGTEEPFADSVINIVHIPDLDVTKVTGLSQELNDKASKSTVTTIQEQLETKADLVDGKIQESQLPASLAYSQQYTINREVLDDGSFRMTINHGMGKRPTVTVTDEAGNIVDLDIQFTDDNTVRLSWSGDPLVNGKIYIV